MRWLAMIGGGVLLLLCLALVVGILADEDVQPVAEAPTDPTATERQQMIAPATPTPTAPAPPSPTPTERQAPVAEPTETPTNTPTPEPTPVPTDTPRPENTPTPTPEPTNTPRPTATPQPTNTPRPRPLTLYIDAINLGFDTVNVRAQPDFESRVVAEAPHGTRVTAQRDPVQEGGRTWYRVTYEGQRGYVSAAVLSAESPEPALTFSGSDSDVTRRFELPSPVSTLTMEHSGESNFIVTAYEPNGEEEQLANAIGDYQGSTALFSEDGGEWMLEVQANGNWDIGIRPAELALAPIGALTGSGSGVSDLFEPEEQGPVPYEFSHDGESNFIVNLWCAGGEELPVNEIGAVHIAAVVNFSEGPCMWRVEADGDWSFAPR